MKSEAVLATFRAFLDNDRNQAITLLGQIEAGERSNGRTSIATSIRRLIDLADRSSGQGGRGQLMQLSQLPNNANVPNSLEIRQTSRTLDSVILNESTRSQVDNFISEWKYRDKLASHGLPVRKVVLLCGPSGTGKTSLAHAISNAISLPFAMAKYEGLIDSHMGESGKSIAKVMEFANRIPCVLFFDEADGIMMKRGGGDGGVGGAQSENNRIINQMLIKLDDLANSSLVIFATNADHMLDPALSRRIGMRVHLGLPGERERIKMFELMHDLYPILCGTGWGADLMMGKKLGFNTKPTFADIESAALEVARKKVLAMAMIDNDGLNGNEEVA